MIYLFGVIGMQGIALMIAEKVNLYDPRQLALGAIILVVGIGGTIGYPNGFQFRCSRVYSLVEWPPIATGALFGILLNLIFMWFKPGFERAAVNK